MGLLTTQTIKNLNLKIQDDGRPFLKTVKSPYPHNRSTDFDDFDVLWHADAEPVSKPRRPLKSTKF